MDDVALQAAQQQSRTYYGKYRGFVADNADPQSLGRVKLRVPSVLGEQDSDWALPCFPYGGLDGQGLFLVPDAGAQVWVEFEEGNLDKPIWTGTFHRPSDPPPEAARVSPPTTRTLTTAAGHRLQFDDAGGEERVTLAHTGGANLTLEPDGNAVLANDAGAVLTLDSAGSQVVLEDGQGNTLTMSATGTTVEDANGNAIEMAPAGITVKGTLVTIQGSQVAVGGQGGEPLIKGPSFLALFATHMHTCTAPGSPSSPPIPQGEFSTLTTKTTAT